MSTADLHASGAEDHGCGHATGIADATGGDHWYVEGIDQLRQQGEGAELAAKVEIQKMPTMAASFQSLGDHRIDAAFL